MADFAVERQVAYEKLADVVERLAKSRRSTRSASVKPRLQWTLEGFDEQQLGFRTFRSFLEAAAAAGHVTLRPVSNAPDVEVLPTEAPEPTAENGPGRIRRDLWSAFVDWRPGWTRLYDRETDGVAWLPAAVVGSEPPAVAALRKAWQADANRFVPIVPVDQETTIEWIRAFVDEAGGEHAEALRLSLEARRPIQAFVAAARDAGSLSAWNAQRLGRVRGLVDTWMREHNLTIDLQGERPLLTAPTRGRPRLSGSRQPATDDDVRRRVIAAVERMSRAELLRLPIPIEYILD